MTRGRGAGGHQQHGARMVQTDYDCRMQCLLGAGTGEVLRMESHRIEGLGPTTAPIMLAWVREGRWTLTGDAGTRGGVLEPQIDCELRTL